MELTITTPLVSTNFPQKNKKIHHITNIPERNDATHIICIILNTLYQSTYTKNIKYYVERIYPKEGKTSGRHTKKCHQTPKIDKTLHKTITIEQHQPHQTTWLYSGDPERWAVTIVTTPVVLLLLQTRQ